MNEDKMAQNINDLVEKITIHGVLWAEIIWAVQTDRKTVNPILMKIGEEFDLPWLVDEDRLWGGVKTVETWAAGVNVPNVPGFEFCDIRGYTRANKTVAEGLVVINEALRTIRMKTEMVDAEGLPLMQAVRAKWIKVARLLQGLEKAQKSRISKILDIQDLMKFIRGDGRKAWAGRTVQTNKIGRDLIFNFEMSSEEKLCIMRMQQIKLFGWEEDVQSLIARFSGW